MSTPSSRAADRARIAAIEAQILSLEDSIQILKDEKFLAQERLNSYAYPVLGLPNEIISEIFIFCLPVYPSPPPLLGIRSPTNLSHICRKWREIAWSTPALWRAIEWPMDAEEGTLEIIESWLSRSRSLPLSFAMDSIWDVVSNECLAALVLHRARWEYITLGASNELDVLAIHGAMPLLRGFELRVDDYRPSVSLIPFHDVPRLRSLTLWDFRCPADFLPWSQLTSLPLIFDPMESSVVLQHAVNLVHCHLVLPDGPMSGLLDVSLPRLKSLVLMPLSYADSATNYLTSLITPALRTLQVPEGFLGRNPIYTLSHFFVKSQCHLEELCITGDTRAIPESSYHNAFPQIPNVAFDMDVTEYAVNRIGDNST
ncbi:hypothetical protein C8R45DRAFT_995522 [Mycena sanguinolenta]|nr:hypothetical protein C8R45DRAFT_995522 [Mycena sanguinolenta]